MSTNQPLADALPVIENVLIRVPAVIAGAPQANTQNRVEGWNALEERIVAWAAARGEPDVRTDEDGYRLPNGKTVAVALEIVTRLREARVTLPLRSGQTANGGINFEWRSGNRTERLTVNAEGETELVKFENSRLVSRKPIAIGPTQR